MTAFKSSYYFYEANSPSDQVNDLLVKDKNINVPLGLMFNV